ncbi:MAG: hypothetical protein ACK5QT_03260 [Oligoflexia bacterium]|jgi:hypothetical protein
MQPFETERTPSLFSAYQPSTAPSAVSTPPPPPTSPAQSASIGSLDDLGRVFNTALITTRGQPTKDWGAEIQQLMETPAFRSFLGSIRHLARSQGVSEAAAAEEMIRTIRRLDAAWQDYVFQEGLERLRS